MAGSVDEVLSRVGKRLPKGFPARTWDTVSVGLKRHAETFLGSDA
jgi:hypothetical protein